jgi:WD40 repeat protein
MNQRPISVTLSTQSLTVQPDESPAALDIFVRNDSDQQAQFQVELFVPGANPNAGSEWYRLEPEVSVAKPPGDTTRFQVSVFASPLPNFSGTTTLTVRVTSPQLPGEERRVLRLIILPGAIAAPVSVSLMPPHLQTYPRNAVDITVRVRNLTYQPLEVLLKLSGILPGWLTGGAERSLTLNPNAEQILAFPCQPPALTHAPSRAYGLRVEAITKGSSPIGAEGILEVLPIGFLRFAADPIQQSIPAKGALLPDWKTKTATVYGAIENLSNVEQKVGLTVQNQVPPGCQWELPIPANLGLRETVKLPLQVLVERPWVGLGRRLKLVLSPQLQIANAVEVEPPQQAVDLKVLPIVPLWLSLALLALVLALLALLLRPQPPGHTDLVNAVRFNGDGLSVVSGSQDCTVRWWRVEGNRLRPEGEFSGSVRETCNSQPLQKRGTLAFADRSVNVLEFFPKENNRVAAGTDNGSVQILELATRRLIQTIKDPADTKTDRVFALAFTDDARTLFSGHGSGTIRVWQRPSDSQNFPSQPEPALLKVPQNQQVRALAISPNGQTLISSGANNSLFLWQLGNATPQPQPILPIAGDKAPPFADFIWSIAFVPNSQTLATSDSNGNLVLWQLDQCQSEATDLRCPVQFQQASPATHIRSVRVSQDGRWLASAGDDGRVMLWQLDENRRFSGQRRLVYHSDAAPQQKQIPTIDLKNRERDLLIVTGGYDRQVKLHRVVP